MKKNNTAKGLLGLIFLTTAMSSSAQITESIGTISSNGASIASHESANRFDQLNLTYSGTGTIRTSSVSNGYLGSSAGLNIQLLATQTIELRTLDASTATTSDSITFGIAKSTNASDGTEMILEYSVDNGISWTAIPFAALPTGTGTTFNLATPKWYRRGATFPSGAISANLRLRFRSNVAAGVQNPQFRIDDIRTTKGTPVVCGSSTASISASGSTVFCAGTGNVNLTATTSVAGPAYQWYNQDGLLPGETNATLSSIVNSGTFYVIVNGAGGCQATSLPQYVRSYPTPVFCFDEVEACTGETIDVCAKLSTSDLIFSEYVEGTGFNKYLEIFNGTCNPVDLSNYVVNIYSNGSCNAAFPIALSGTLASGDVYVIVNRDAADTLIGDLVTDDLTFNGNDAVALFNTGSEENVDIIGSICFDPGSAWRDTSTVTSSPTKGWTTLNKTLVRKACVYSGVNTNPALPGATGFPTLYTEWDTLSVDNITGLGVHAVGGSNYTFTVSGAGTGGTPVGNCVPVLVRTGVTTITLTNADFCGFNNCFSDVVVATVTGAACGSRSSSAADDMKATGINVYPNPFNESATVTFSNEFAGNVTITLTDMQGKTVAAISNQYMEAGEQRIELVAAGLKAGSYVGRIETANGVQTFRVEKLNH